MVQPRMYTEGDLSLKVAIPITLLMPMGDATGATNDVGTKASVVVGRPQHHGLH